MVIQDRSGWVQGGEEKFESTRTIRALDEEEAKRFVITVNSKSLAEIAKQKRAARTTFQWMLVALHLPGGRTGVNVSTLFGCMQRQTSSSRHW
jgi:hypothetical protein